MVKLQCVTVGHPAVECPREGSADPSQLRAVRKVLPFVSAMHTTALAGTDVE